MKNNKPENSFLLSYSFLLLLTILIKLPYLFTHHIQEDAFITWKVAKNFLEYGSIGFNGTERISASTTHLYMLMCALFQWLLGQYFIYPLLIFNSILFGIGSILLSKLLLFDKKEQFVFCILLNLIPPSITASALGMEYGLLFFLYLIFLYYGIVKNQNWILFLIPVLLIWTRIDAVIFIGVGLFFVLLIRKKILWIALVGLLIGIMSVVGFNYFYFHELINHTIVAKKIAYPDSSGFVFKEFINQFAYYGGYIKKAGMLANFTFYGYFIISLFLLVYSFKNFTKTENAKLILLIIYCFAFTKIFTFTFLKAHFDWYYWLPRVLMGASVIYFLVSKFQKTSGLIVVFILFCGFYMFQLLQSLSIGYMENTQRMQIVRDLLVLKPKKNESILLEPAGKIPFYTDLYIIDEVGLVNQKMTDAFIKDFDNAWSNIIAQEKPTYILTLGAKPGGNALYRLKPEAMSKFNQNYSLIKSYPIAQIHKQAPEYVKLVYRVRAIGKDYFLYKRNENLLNNH